MNRPIIHIDWKVVDSMLEAGCLGTDIAQYFAMHPDTFYARTLKEKGMGFTAYSQQKRAKGESDLRLAQHLKALGKTKKGDNTLLIWLGKQRLNQKENAQEDKFPEEVLKPFTDIMNQIGSLQSARKIDDNNISSEAKSA